LIGEGGKMLKTNRSPKHAREIESMGGDTKVFLELRVKVEKEIGATTRNAFERFGYKIKK